MNLVICIAGLNTRFHNAGFDIPKYLLPFNDPFGKNVVITSILKELTTNIDVNKIVLVANIRDIFFKSQLQEATSQFDTEIIYTVDTPGQATTGLIGVSHLISQGFGDQPVLIHNGDTIVSIDRITSPLAGPDVYELVSTHDVSVHTFPGNNPAWSYVTTKDDSDIITAINEKQTVTGYASSGLYGFRSSQFYKERYFDTIFTLKEFYISDVISNILKIGNGIKFESNLNPIILGTPAEYFDALAKQSL